MNAKVTKLHVKTVNGLLDLSLARSLASPAPPPAEGPELRPGLGLAVGPLLEPRPVSQSGLHVHAVEAPRHHGQQQYHGGQETREPERVVAQGLRAKRNNIPA